MTEMWHQLFELVKNLYLIRNIKGNNNAIEEHEMSIGQASSSLVYRESDRANPRKRNLAVRFDANQLQQPEVDKPRYISSTRLLSPSKAKKLAAVTLAKVTRSKKHNMSPH